MAVQQLHYGKEQEPETNHGGEDAENEDGGTAVIQMAARSGKRIQIRIGNPAKPHAGTECGHQQKGNGYDDTEVEHSDSSFLDGNAGDLHKK